MDSFKERIKSKTLLSAEGAAPEQAFLFRAFGAHLQCLLNPGLTAGPIHYRSFGPGRHAIPHSIV
jgi:hypothetical protein